MIDFEMPKFLRRERNKTMVDDLLKRDHNRQRAWAPIRKHVPAPPRPVFTEHPDLPVKVQVKDPKRSGSTLLATYANMAEFEAKHDKGSYPVRGQPMLFNNHNVVLVTAKPWAGKEKKPAGPKASTVIVDKVQYDSVLAAFETLQLPVSKHQKFRAELKQKRKLTFLHQNKKFKFSYPGGKK